MRMKLAFIFFWAIGIAGLYIPIQVAVSGEERLLLTEFQNPLIRYAVPLMFTNLSIVSLLIPILMLRGVITQDYYNAEKYAKAKANFVLLSLSAPGWIFLSVAAYYLAASRKALFILGIILLFVYISSIITLLKHKS
jgi:hypothetical protein